MTIIFHDKMHQEMEDYADDIVVKSRRQEDHGVEKGVRKMQTFQAKNEPVEVHF